MVVVRILSFSHSNSNSAQLRVPDLLVYQYMVSSNVTFHSKRCNVRHHGHFFRWCLVEVFSYLNTTYSVFLDLGSARHSVLCALMQFVGQLVHNMASFCFEAMKPHKIVITVLHVCVKTAVVFALILHAKYEYWL